MPVMVPNEPPPVEPWKRASPEVKTPPSVPTRQAPRPLGVAAMAITGALSGRARIDADGITRGRRWALASSTSAAWAAPFDGLDGVRADADPVVAATTLSVASRIAGRASRLAPARLLRTIPVPPRGVPDGHPNEVDRHGFRVG
jgi:hypothetical protein